jgi:hypothetical protein
VLVLVLALAPAKRQAVDTQHPAATGSEVAATLPAASCQSPLPHTAATATPSVRVGALPCPRRSPRAHVRAHRPRRLLVSSVFCAE